MPFRVSSSLAINIPADISWPADTMKLPTLHPYFSGSDIAGQGGHFDNGWLPAIVQRVVFTKHFTQHKIPAWLSLHHAWPK